MAIHPTAIIDPAAELDPTVDVGPHVIIEAPARIGPRTRILANAVIGKWTDIGADNTIHYGAIIGHAPQYLTYDGAEGWTRIGDRNTIREYATIHRGFDTESGAETRIGDDCFLMGLIHVAHDCRIGHHVIMVNGSGLAGHVIVEDQVFISGAALVHQFVRIGTLAMIEGMGKVRKDVPPFMLLSGNATIRGLNVVGLRRAGLDPAARLAIKRAYTTLYRKGLPVSDALEEIEKTPLTPEVEHLVGFIRASKRGICKHYQRDAGESDE